MLVYLLWERTINVLKANILHAACRYKCLIHVVTDQADLNTDADCIAN